MTLNEFLNEWDKKYNEEASHINIFKTELTSQWSDEQKSRFALIFYHLRGHFHDFLWYVGSHADDKETKDIILKNIAEEFNGSAKSHEQLYIEFAKSVGADVTQSLVDEKDYIEFAKTFNHNHLKWLHAHGPDNNFAALSAYERLDNIDYLLLLKLAKSLDVTTKGQIFFKIHSVVEHFSPTFDKLSSIWDSSSVIVQEAFNFIGKNQLEMWKNLSDEIFNNHNLTKS